mgnify:CR=1 FL=1
MGGMGSILSMMPGMGNQLSGVDMDEGEKSMHRVESIILSMTKEERANPNLINPSRKQRIAKGAGVEVSEVNRLVKQFDQMKKMMKQMPALWAAASEKADSAVWETAGRQDEDALLGHRRLIPQSADQASQTGILLYV